MSNKVNKTDKPLARMTKKKGEKIKLLKSRMKDGILSPTLQKKKIIKESYE